MVAHVCDVPILNRRMEGALGAHRGRASLALPGEMPLHLYSRETLSGSEGEREDSQGDLLGARAHEG